MQFEILGRQQLPGYFSAALAFNMAGLFRKCQQIVGGAAQPLRESAVEVANDKQHSGMNDRFGFGEDVHRAIVKHILPIGGRGNALDMLCNPSPPLPNQAR
eukprot:4946220-Heterocapsa_arctica.AAC.1